MWRLPVDGKNFTNWILMVFLFGREILYHVGHLVSHLVNLHVHHHVGHLVNLHVYHPPQFCKVLVWYVRLEGSEFRTVSQSVIDQGGPRAARAAKYLNGVFTKNF